LDPHRSVSDVGDRIGHNLGNGVAVAKHRDHCSRTADRLTRRGDCRDIRRLRRGNTSTLRRAIPQTDLLTRLAQPSRHRCAECTRSKHRRDSNVRHEHSFPASRQLRVSGATLSRAIH
jgi:hypothetical protein